MRLSRITPAIPVAFFFLLSCQAPQPSLPRLPSGEFIETFGPRQPAGNKSGNLSQYALKGSFKGKDKLEAPCEIKAESWGDNGSGSNKEYLEFSITGFDRWIRTNFWPIKLDGKNPALTPAIKNFKIDFEAKYVLFGNRYIEVPKDRSPQSLANRSLSKNAPEDPEKVALTIYLDGDQSSVMAYRFIHKKGKERTETLCKITKNELGRDASIDPQGL